MRSFARFNAVLGFNRLAWLKQHRLTQPLQVLLVLLALLLLSGCLDSSSSGSDDDDNTLPLPEATETTFLDGRYIARGEQQDYIEDTHTGLVWKRCADGQTWDLASASCLGRPTQLTFAQASGEEVLEDEDNPNILYLTGFMMPTRDQLQTLIYCSDQPLSAETIGQGECTGLPAAPTIVAEVFPDTSAATHWTSTCMSNECRTYYGVNFSTGEFSTFNSPSARYPLRRVRPVR